MLKRALRKLEQRVAELEADLSPPLGKPGGILHTTKRIEDAIEDDRLESGMIKQLEQGESISNQEARLVYRFDDCNTIESGLKVFKGFCVSSHAQFRMDQRGITVSKLRGFFFNLEKYIERNEYNLRAQDLIRSVEKGWETKWTDQYSQGLTVVFRLKGNSAKIITAFYKNKKDPKMISIKQPTNRWR